MKMTPDIWWGLEELRKEVFGERKQRIAGFLFEILGFRTTFLIGAIITCLSIVPTLIFVKERKSR